MAGVIEVEAEALVVLRSLTGIAAERQVQLEIALQQHLTVRTDRAVFREVLEALLIHAIYAAPNSRVLLGTMSHDGGVQVVVVDDGTGVDQQTQQEDLARASQLALLLHGVLEVDYRAGEGTTVLLRLPGEVLDPSSSAQPGES
jgi:nitrate/nitrite-specific signal transduction histidine kinase